METMKEKMATMMEAMMSMRKIMEANTVTVAATSAAAKVNSMPPSDLKLNESSNLRYATEGQVVGDIPLQNTLEGP